MMIRPIICWLRGHDYEWHRVNIPRRFSEDGPQLWKWRGECKRCGDWTTRIPAEMLAGSNLDDYPNLKKFVREHTK